MPKVWNIQSNFAQGELDPRLLGRVDLAVYYNALRRARDVTPTVQGGISWRDGGEFIDETATQALRIFSFEFSTTDAYLLAFADSRMYIYKDGDTLQTNISGSGNDYLTTTFTAAQIPDLDIIQSADTVIITHPELSPLKIIRTSDTAWVISTIALTNIPQFDFDDASSPTPVSEVQSVVFANQNTSDRYRMSLDGILTEDIVFGNDMTANASNMQIAIQDLPNTANSGVTVVAVNITTYTVTFADASADDWELMAGAAINVQEASFSITVTETSPGTARSEDTWSAGRGWPVTCTFHEGRLYFGGSTSRPQTLWGSVVGDFFNFNDGRGRDGEGIEATLDTDQVNAIQGIFSNRSLQIFTTGQEFFVPVSPITPETVSVIPQTNFGSKRIRPITIDGRTLYIQRTGKAIREFIQSSDVSQLYNSNSISLLASHIVLNPSRMAASRGSTEVDANYAYFVNSDGSLLIYNALGAEGVTGFTLWNVEGSIVHTDVAVVNDEVFVLLTEGTDTYISRMNSDRVTDLSVKKATPANGIFTGLDHLEGKTVNIVGDGAFDGTAVVSGGQVTVDSDHTNTEVGLNFTPLIETMPLNVPLDNGPNFSEPKKVNRVTLDFFESLGLIVSNSTGYTVRIADKTMALDVFDNPTPHTGREDVWLLGWDNVATVTVTRDTPVPATILTIGVEIGV